MRSVNCLIFLLFFSPLFAQDLSQTLRGKITAADASCIQNANVFISGDTSLTILSDSAGLYSARIKPGQYSVTAAAPGFQSQRKNDIILLSGKQQIVNLELSPSKFDLHTVEINAEKKAGIIRIQLEEMQHYAAVFYDPARVITSNAGVINTDDQANNISVHGATPAYNQWMLEGAEIVNPNHLENAGTLNDRPSLNGGGVCILSAQLLKNSAFSLSPSEANDAGAVSGIFKMDFRPGNEEKREHVIQASLLGTDLSTEGPFVKNKKASYLVNARYSTIGLLNLIGIDFGDERITYSDVSWKLQFPHKRGYFSTFGFAGESTTDFSGKTDSAAIKIEKDLCDIHYRSFTIAGGISSLIRLKTNLALKNVLVYSSKDVKRIQDPLHVVPSDVDPESDKQSQQKLSSVHSLTANLGEHILFRIGTHLNLITTLVSSGLSDSTRSQGFRDLLILPFISGDITISKTLHLKLGANGFYQERINYFRTQPLAEIVYSDHLQSLSLRYSEGTQLQPFLIYARAENRELGPASSQNLSLTHFISNEKISFNTEVYYCTFSHLPADTLSGFCSYNYLNETIPFVVTNKGKARNYGVDETLHLTAGKFYSKVSLGIFNSVFEIRNTYQKSRFNSGYNLMLIAGREFAKGRNKFGIDMRGTVRNGFKQSAFLNSSTDMNYVRPLPVYYRADLRLSYTKQREKRSTIWAIDIQNVTNRKNVAYEYYDEVTGKVETKYQLGIIPVLSYKLLF